LPDRLRLLGLPGEERARSVLQGCSDLLQEDAGGAASILGMPESSLPADVKWVREAVDSLDGDGEAQVRRAATLQRELADLVELFPDLADAALVAPLELVRDVLASESFATRLADLRGAVVALEEAVRVRYADARNELIEAVRAERAALETVEGWAQLDPEDRERIAARLLVDDVPRDPGADQLVAALRRLATRAARLPSLRVDCLAEVRRLAAEIAEENTGEEDTGAVKSTAQVVDVGALVAPVVLDGEQALDAWIRTLRQRLMQLVELGPVRILGRGDD